MMEESCFHQLSQSQSSAYDKIPIIKIGIYAYRYRIGLVSRPY